MATAEKMVYVCDQCSDEEDEDTVGDSQRWIQVTINGQFMQFCEDCWVFI